MNNDNLLIEQSDIELARDLCKFIKEPDLRNRAVANALAAEIAIKYFEEHEVDTTSGLHNVSTVLENIEIADIYVNDAYIDVRLYFDENELCVPKSHFDLNIQPVAYMFIKLDPELSGGNVAGFIPANNIDKTIEKEGYYLVDESDLISFYDIEPMLISEADPDLPENIEALIYDYLDDKIEDTASFYKLLISSKELREILIKAAAAQNIFNFVSLTDVKQTSSEFEQSDISPATEITQLEAPENFEQLEADSTDDEFIVIDNSIEKLNVVDEDNEDLLEDFSSDNLLEENSLEEFETSSLVEESFDEIETDSLEEDTLVEVNPIASESFIDDSFDNLEETISDDIDTTETVLIADAQGDLSAIENESALTTKEPIDDMLEYSVETDEPLDSELEETSSPEEEVVILDEVQDNTEKELEDNNIEYSTTVSPSMDSIKASSEVNIEELEDVLDKDEQDSLNQEITGNHTSEERIENDTEIEELFGDYNSAEEYSQKTYTPQNNKKNGIIPILGTITIIAAIGYYGYTKFIATEPPAKDITESAKRVATPVKTQNRPVADAMPIETVENIKNIENYKDGTAITIPAIENNLDASILVSNLSVNWEVPSGYVNNNSAKRYFVKMGKIIQLNLKTELLLLTKQPITNRITVELEFNQNTNHFDVKGIVSSSGEKAIDDLIVQTIKKALDLNISSNMSTFGNIQGNPILVIQL